MSELKGLEELYEQLKDVSHLDWVSAEVEGMNVIADEARALVAVDTGALQLTIDVEVDGEQVNLVAGSNDVDYATYVEFGTIKMAAQPYMRPAIDTKQREADLAIAENINKQMRRAV